MSQFTFVNEYNRVIEDLKKLSKPKTCNLFSCIFNPIIFNGEIFQKTYLQRTTHTLCKNQNCTNSISCYGHQFCYACCTEENEEEFSYHHRICKDMRKRTFLSKNIYN